MFYNHTMILIGENIHIISKSVRSALIERNEAFIKNLIDIQKNTDYVDLNVGPAKSLGDDILPWLVNLVQTNSNLKISLDTTNKGLMKSGLESCNDKENTFINSTSGDIDRLDSMTDLASMYGSNLIALTLSSETGIPKTADGRLEIAFNIYEKCLEKGIDSSKIFFDPLTLPVCVEQGQAYEAINTIKMVKESFDPPVKTLVGLSNISNGCPAELRPLINKVFGVLAYGAGLDAAIIDAKDEELIRIFKMLDSNSPKSEVDELYISLGNMIKNFGEIEDVSFDLSSETQQKIIKCAYVLLNKKIYSHSFTQI